MEIEIVTMKRRMTKSLIKQMPRINRSNWDVLFNGEILGHMINVIKDEPKSILIHHNKEYYTSDINLEIIPICDKRKDGTLIHPNLSCKLRIFLGATITELPSNLDAKTWERELNRVLETANSTHIYVYY